MSVIHGFLEGPGPLFATHHAPEGEARNIAYVLCLPLHLDLIQSHRSMRRFAEVMAEAGFHVLRLHYEGTGESMGSTDFDPDRVKVWLESIRRAVDVMAKIPGIEGVGLLGVRAGATFAAEIATQIDIARLVLWEPSAGAMYGREMEILASSSPQPPPSFGEGVVAGGYWLSKQTLADLAKLDPQKTTLRGKPDVLLVYRGDRKPSPRLQEHLEKQGCQATMVALAGHKEMMVMPQKSAVPDGILAAIRDWAVERSRVAPEVSNAALPLAPVALVNGLRWKTFRFGAAEHLFGILTEPEGGAKLGRAPLLLLTGGVTPRTAGNGSYVALAKRLAENGHAVMRMDVSFIGESGTPNGAPGKENDPFPPSIVDDARAGLERACAAAPSSDKAWVLGLCSGAYAAFHTIADDARAKGVFLVNPERFDLAVASGGEAEAVAAAPAMSTVDQLEQMNRYWQVMRDPKAWKKLLSGKADMRHLAKVLGARIGSKLEATRERIALKLGREAKGLAGDFDKMLKRGVKVWLVFSEGDPGQAAVTTELGARYDELVTKGLGVKVFPGADHNFHEIATRAQWLDWTIATITSRTEPG